MMQKTENHGSDKIGDAEKRREAILRIGNSVEALRKTAEEHQIDFLGYVLRLAKLETELLLSPEDDDLGV